MKIKQRFTLSEYETYRELPDWKLDSDAFDDELEWEKYWVSVANDWLHESQDYFRPVKREWAYAIKRFENTLEKFNTVSQAKLNPENTDLPFLYKACLDLVALLFDTLPRPTYQSKQDSEDDFVNGLNYFAGWEYDANDFDMTMYDIGLDIQLCNLGILKNTVDKSLTGPFGQKGRIQIRRTEPRYIQPDPCAAKLDWKLCRYIGVAEPYDVGDIRAMYPSVADLIEAEPEFSPTRDSYGQQEDEANTGHIIDSPANDNTSFPFAIGQRQRACLKEFWFHDQSVKFVADEDDETVEPLVDNKGYVIGEWVKRFPEGRCIVVCGDLLLANFANPSRSGQPPFVFFTGRPTKSALTPGDATFLLIVERKLNDINKRIMKMAVVNTERPTMIDSGAFDAPSRWRMVQNFADSIIQVRPGSNIAVMPAGEIPTFVGPFLDFLMSFFDDLMGIQSVQRGQLTEGAQISAQALGDLQSQAGTRSRMKARFIEAGLKNEGQQIQWLIRETYPEDYEVPTTDPTTKKQVPVKWSNQRDGDEYPVAIQAGSSLPGAKQGAFQQAVTLYDKGIVDDEYVMACAQIPGAQKILQRTEQKKLEMIKTEAEGRAMGLRAKEFQKPDEGPGRKPQEM